MDSDSEDYFKSWIPVTNRVKDRLKDRSLVHTFSSKRRIAESTKEFNKYSRKFNKLLSYKQFLECKKGILEKVSEDKVVTDESDLSDDDFIQYYNSFHNSDVKHDGKFDPFSWNEYYKNSKYYKSINSKEDTNCHSLGAINNVSIAIKSQKVSNVKKFDNKQTSLKKVQFDSKRLIENQSKSKSNQSPKLLNNNANDSDTSSSNNVDSSKTNNENKKVTRRASSVNKVGDLENSSSKKITTKKKSTNVKRNLTSVLNDVESKVIEPLDEDDWNDEFIASDFVAQSTQICSDTFSEINQRKTRKSLNIFKLAQNEKVNQPRDSGIEEDSREDNLNNDSLTNNKKISNEKKKNLEDKISDKRSKRKECNLEHRTQENNSNNNELPVTDRDSLTDKNEICTNKKLPLKVKEEKITKKYTIISKEEDMKLRPVEEETYILKSDDKAKENNESKNEYVDTQITESDKNSEKEEEEEVEEEEESNNDYQDLRDYGTEDDSNDDKKNSEAENDISVDKAVPLNRSTKSKSKNELKNKLKRCKSPFMKQKYKELNQLGLLSDSEVEPIEENIEKPYFSLTPIDIESITNDTTFGKNSKNKSEKLKNSKASDEDATVSKESTDNDPKMTHNEPNEKYEEVGDDIQDLLQNGERDHQPIKKLDFSKNSESSDDSEDENINKKLTEKSEGNSQLPNSKKYNQQMKRMGLDSSSEDSDDSRNSKKRKNEEEMNKTTDKNGKDKNNKNIRKSEDTSQSENNYNNTENVKKSTQNFLTKVDDDHEQDLSQNGKRDHQPIKKLDFSKNSESSDDSEDENINTKVIEKAEENSMLQNSKKYNQQMKKMGLYSSSEDSDDSRNPKKEKNEEEMNKTNDKKGKNKNKKNISKSEDTSQSENRNKYNNTDNVKKSGHNFLTKVDDDDEQDLSQNSKRHLQQMKRLDFFKNSESSDDSEDENINKKLTEKSEGNSQLHNSTKYNQQMKRMGLDSSTEDSDDSSNSKKVNNEEEMNKTNDEKDEDKNKKNISKSQDTSKSENKYNNTENVKKSGQSFNNSNVQDNLISNTTSPQSSQSISKSSKFKDTKKNKNRLKKNKNEEISSSREQSYEIEKQDELTKVVKNYKQSMQSKPESDASDAEKKTSLHTKKDHQVKQLDHGNDEPECSVEGNLMAHSKKKSSINNKINETKHNKKENKSLDNTTKLHTTSEESEDDTISSNPKSMLEKLRIEYDQVNSSENSNPSEKLNVINSADCDSNIDIEEHKILNEDKVPEAIKSIHQDNSNSSVMNENRVAMVRNLECNKSDKESSCSTSQNVDVEHYSSESETTNKRKRKKNYNSDSSEKDKEIDVVTLSPKALNHLKKFKRYDFSKESEEESDNEELVKNLNEEKHKNSIKDTGSSNLKMVINSSDDESDNDESDREMSPSTKQRLKQYKKMNLVCTSNSSSSEDENIIAVKNKISTDSLFRKNDSEKQKWFKKTHLFDSDSESIKSEKSNQSQKNNKSDVDDVLKKKSPNKSNSPKGHIHSKKADTKINDTIDDIEDGKTHNNSKNIIICETQDSEGTQKESQDLFSSLEDLTKGVHQDISKLAEGSELDSNTEIANQIPPIQQCKKIYTKRIKRISELVEKEDLSEGSYESTMTLKDIGAHEEIFILEVPKSVFSDGDLIGKKMTFSKTTLMFGDNNMYEAFQRNVSPTYSCVFKSENNTKNSFQTLNVRPTTEIVARRKKDLDDSNKQGDLERDEENEQSEISLGVSEKSHTTAVKTEINASKKLYKKKSNAENEKEIKKSEKEKRKKSKVLRKSKTAKGPFHLSRFLKRKRPAKLVEEHKLSEEEFDSEIKLSLDSDKDSIKDEKNEKDDKVFTNISNNICPKSKKSKTSVGKAVDVDLDKETSEKKAKDESKSGIAKIKAVNKKSSNTNARNDNKESDKKSKPLINKENKSKNKDTNEIKPEVKKESKQKKLKIAVMEDKPETNEPTAGPSSDTAAKKPKTPKKKANNDTKPAKRKAETKADDDAVDNTKKRKVATEKKPKSPASVDKTAVPSKPTKKTTAAAKKKKPPMADAAAKEILNIIQSTMKFNKEKLDSSNSSLDNSKYGALDIERVSSKNKRYASTTSSSDEDGKFSRHSFKVRSKPDEKEGESSSSDDEKDKIDVKDDDKKKKKKSFFFDE